MKSIMSLLLFAFALWFFVATERPPAATAVPLAAYSTALPPAAIVDAETAVNQADPSPSGVGAELLHPTAALIDVARYGRAIDYCLVGSWSDPQRAAVASGLAIWQPSGVAFHEAATMAECETAVSWSGELGPAIAGRATVGPGEIMLSPFWAANGCNLVMMAAHEAGHNLGPNDQPAAAGGLMRNDDCYQTGPTAAELAAVAWLWGTK